MIITVQWDTITIQHVWPNDISSYNITSFNNSGYFFLLYVRDKNLAKMPIKKQTWLWPWEAPSGDRCVWVSLNSGPFCKRSSDFWQLCADGWTPHHGMSNRATLPLRTYLKWWTAYIIFYNILFCVGINYSCKIRKDNFLLYITTHCLLWDSL